MPIPLNANQQIKLDAQWIAESRARRNRPGSVV